MGFMFGPRDDMGDSLKALGALLAVAVFVAGVAVGLLIVWIL